VDGLVNKGEREGSSTGERILFTKISAAREGTNIHYFKNKKKVIAGCKPDWSEIKNSEEKQGRGRFSL